MARYTRSLSVALSLSNCLTQLKAVLESCDLEALFSKEDCIIAREKPGKVPFAKLVTIEVLVDSTRATSNVTNMDVVVKNEELPLQSNNHCFQIFDQFSQAINQHSGWQVIAEAEEPNQSQTASAESPATPTAATTPQATLKIETAPAAAQPLASEPIAPVSANAQAEPVVQLPKAADLPLPQSFTDTAPELATPPESVQSNTNDSINLEPTAEKRVQTTANLEELRQKRAESVANLERLRQKRAESIANLEKMRQKRERMFAANEREGTGEDISSLDLPERPSTSQA
ncbi:hypothetical protein [Acaryochloris marina]|uniref:hypothetical protein n=1 Tax=Acaryochloris marina TaxID=155978 RepID=UPI00201789D9|nr:hypothetical protein [Acaryochloris marina]